DLKRSADSFEGAGVAEMVGLQRERRTGDLMGVQQIGLPAWGMGALVHSRRFSDEVARCSHAGGELRSVRRASFNHPQGRKITACVAGRPGDCAIQSWRG